MGLYHVGDFLSDDETLLAKIAADCKSLNQNMVDLYQKDHHGSMFLDIAELYLQTALAEFNANKLAAKNLLSKTDNPRGAAILDSLENHHAARFNAWVTYEKKDSANC